MKKRSVVWGTLKTSVSLEDEFWSMLKLIATEQNLSIGRYVETIAKERGNGNLSSALRLAVLNHVRAKSGGGAVSMPKQFEQDEGYWTV